MAERGVKVDHSTLNRWVVKFSPLIAVEAQMRKVSTKRSWCMDGTYVRVRGKWVYLYRAVDKSGKTLEFMLSERRNEAAATLFFGKALSSNGLPEKIVIDKSNANRSGIKNTNKVLARFGCPIQIKIVRSKHLNNIVEQDHRFIRKRIRPMGGFKSVRSVTTTISGIVVTQIIRKNQFCKAGELGFHQFAELAGELRQFHRPTSA